MTEAPRPPETPPAVSPGEARAVIAREARARAEACWAEVQEVLKKFSCDLVFVEHQKVNGHQPPGGAFGCRPLQSWPDGPVGG